MTWQPPASDPIVEPAGGGSGAGGWQPPATDPTVSAAGGSDQGSSFADRVTHDFAKTGIPNELLRIGTKVIGGGAHMVGGLAHMLLPVSGGAPLDEAEAKALKGGAPLPLVDRALGHTRDQAIAEAEQRGRWAAALSKWTDPGNFFDWIRNKYTTPPATPLGKFGEGAASVVAGALLPIPGSLRGEVEGDLVSLDPAKLMGQRGPMAQYARLFNYKVAPSEQEGQVLGKEIQGAAGVPHTEQAISDHNAERAAEDVRMDLELPEDAPLNEETYDALRERAGNSYDDARQVSPFKRDPQMLAEAQKLGSDALEFEATHPGSYEKQTIAEINRLRNMFLTNAGEEWVAAHAVEGVKLLRAQARNAFRAAGDNPQPELVASLRKQAADILEGALARAADAEAMTRKELFGIGSRIRAARRTIAKAYEAEAATFGGRIDPQALRLAKKHGAPLDGAMDRIAMLAEMFPKSFRSPRTLTKMGAQSGRWFTRMAALGGMLSHNPKMALLYVGQTVAKHLAESDFFQPGSLAQRAGNKALDFVRDASEEGRPPPTPESVRMQREEAGGVRIKRKPLDQRSGRANARVGITGAAAAEGAEDDQ